MSSELADALNAAEELIQMGNGYAVDVWGHVCTSDGFLLLETPFGQYRTFGLESPFPRKLVRLLNALPTLVAVLHHQVADAPQEEELAVEVPTGCGHEWECGVDSTKWVLTRDTDGCVAVLKNWNNGDC